MDSGQAQVAEVFGYKWTRTPNIGVDRRGAAVMTPWMMGVLGFADEGAYARYLSRFRTMLDAGCGNGRETARMARLNPSALVVGLDLSDGIEVAARGASGLTNARFVRGDLNNPPALGSFDFILSFGVLHHTPDTRAAFLSVAKLLAPGGEFAFYVYRKKAPLREFADDHVRQALATMTPAEAWSEMERITEFGRALSNLKAKIDVPEIRSLGIDGGCHDLQRLIYYTVLKCYWNDGFTFEDNVHINYDWYAPKYAWRHTEDEIRTWMREAGLVETFMKAIPAGYSFRAARP
jgi:SAM-dependent methyltransferase